MALYNQDPSYLASIRNYEYDWRDPVFREYVKKFSVWEGDGTGFVEGCAAHTAITDPTVRKVNREVADIVRIQRGRLQEIWRLYKSNACICKPAAYAAALHPPTPGATPSQGGTMKRIKKTFTFVSEDPLYIDTAVGFAKCWGVEVTEATEEKEAAAPKEEKEEADPDAPDITSDGYKAMFAAIQDFISKGGDKAKATVRTLLAKLKVDKISAIPASKYGIVQKTVENQISKLAPAEEADDDLLG